MRHCHGSEWTHRSTRYTGSVPSSKENRAIIGLLILPSNVLCLPQGPGFRYDSVLLYSAPFLMHRSRFVL
jgi:hypothetical protein